MISAFLKLFETPLPLASNVRLHFFIFWNMGKTIFMGSKAELFPRQENQGSYIWCQEEIDNAVAKLQLIAIELQWVNGFFAVALSICACGSYGTKITYYVYEI